MRVASILSAVAIALATTVSLIAAPIDNDDLSIGISPSTTTASDSVDESPEGIVRETITGEKAKSSSEVPPALAALKAFNEGDIDECLSQLKTAMAQRPTLPDPDITLAGFYLRDGNVTEARKLLEKSAAAGSRHPQMYLSLAKLAIAEGRLADAEVHFDKMEALGVPSRWDEREKAWHESSIIEGRASIAERRKNWEQARTLLKSLSQLQPEQPGHKVRLARASCSAGKLDEAFDQLDIAYRQDSRLRRPEISMGVILIQDGQSKAADTWYQKAIKKYPAEPAVRTAYVMALLYQNRAQEAEEQASKAASLGDVSTLLQIQRGIIARQLGNVEEARMHFTKALERDAENAEANYQLIATLAAADEVAEKQQAIEFGKGFVEKSPDTALSHAALGAAYYGNGQFDEAEQSLRKAAALPNLRPESLYLYAKTLSAVGNDKQAQEIANQLRKRIDEPNVFVLREKAREWLKTVEK